MAQFSVGKIGQVENRLVCPFWPVGNATVVLLLLWNATQNTKNAIESSKHFVKCV